MSEKRISHVVGKGSLAHNNRIFIAKNVDRTRTSQNVVLMQMPLADAYSKLFDEAVERYNAKQSRKCRYIKPDYFTHLFNHKICDYTLTANNKQKSFYEDLVQVGDMHDTGCGTPDAETAKQCLTEYYEHYIKNNPNFLVFNAVIHMDEATPHLHINYIPVGHYEKGLDTRNAMAKALEEMGYKGANAATKWRECEREIFTEICISHGFTIATPNKSRGYNFKCEEYREIQEEKKRLTRELQPLREMNLAAESETVRGSKIPLSNKIAVSSNEMVQLEQQKKAAAVQALDNQRERDSLEQYKQSLDKRESEISQKEEQSLNEQSERTNALNIRERVITEKEEKLSEILSEARQKKINAEQLLERAEYDFKRAQQERDFQRDLNEKYSVLHDELFKEQNKNAKNNNILNRIRKALNIPEEDTKTDIAEKCKTLVEDRMAIENEYNSEIGLDNDIPQKSVPEMVKALSGHFKKKITEKDEEIAHCREKISVLSGIKEEFIKVVLALNMLVYTDKFSQGLSGISKALANGISRFIDKCFDRRGEFELINKSVLGSEIGDEMRNFEKEEQRSRNYNTYQR